MLSRSLKPPYLDTPDAMSESMSDPREGIIVGVREMEKLRDPGIVDSVKDICENL